MKRPPFESRKKYQSESLLPMNRGVTVVVPTSGCNASLVYRSANAQLALLTGVCCAAALANVAAMSALATRSRAMGTCSLWGCSECEDGQQDSGFGGMSLPVRWATGHDGSRAMVERL